MLTATSFPLRSEMLETLSVLGYLGMFGGLLGLLAMRSLFSPFPLIIALQVAAILLFFWARFTFGRRSFHAAANPTAGGLVTTGPYRHIRHPIYASVCLFTWAGGAGHWSWSVGLYDGLILAGAMIRISCEEKLVTARYPEYAAYADKTWRMIPFVY
jgi:protein-S-isoprenylcysteine O-methyltransferase Ste14